MSFGTRLLSCMREADITHTELSAITGMDITHISHIVHDDRSPSLTTLTRILKALPEADARWLITGERHV